ncbi:MAG: polyketide antibiotic transporter, partial [Actinomycetota bacterium]|nr:polyketide antibiotic transporter [Actinomycetota bacterium]
MSAVPRLLVAYLRRDRWQLLIWAAVTGLLVFGASTAVGGEFDSEADRRGLVTIAASNPAFLFLRGVPDGFGYGAVLFFMMFAFLGVMAGLMSTFLVTRHTRADEDLGRAELLGGTPAGRSAPLTAVLLLALLANSLLALVVGAALLTPGLPPAGSVLTGVAVAAAGLPFAGFAAVTAQLMPSARGANGIAAAMVGVAYLLRGIGDALAVPSADISTAESAWPAWLSPIGWAQRVAPFTDGDTRPLLLTLGLFAALGGAALWLRAHRDLGASLVRERAGRN